MGVGVPAAMELLSVPVVGNAFMAFMTMIGLTIIAGTVVQRWVVIPMINIIGSFVAFMGAMIFGWMGNLTMTIAMLAGVIYFKEYK